MNTGNGDVRTVNALHSNLDAMANMNVEISLTSLIVPPELQQHSVSTWLSYQFHRIRSIKEVAIVFDPDPQPSYSVHPSPHIYILSHSTKLFSSSRLSRWYVPMPQQKMLLHRMALRRNQRLYRWNRRTKLSGVRCVILYMKTWNSFVEYFIQLFVDQYFVFIH